MFPDRFSVSFATSVIALAAHGMFSCFRQLELGRQDPLQSRSFSGTWRDFSAVALPGARPACFHGRERLQEVSDKPFVSLQGNLARAISHGTQKVCTLDYATGAVWKEYMAEALQCFPWVKDRHLHAILLVLVKTWLGQAVYAWQQKRQHGSLYIARALRAASHVSTTTDSA